MSCQGPTIKNNQPARDNAQKFELLVDGNKKSADPEPVITAAFSQAHLMLGYMSEKEDVQFTISAYLQDLKPGIYQVYDCKSASECGEAMPDNNQIAMYGPFPKDPMPALNLFRIAYYAPDLGLKPLTLTITAVTDETQAGNPRVKKRVEGKFSSTMANVEQVPGGSAYHIVGKTTQVEGSFSLLCSFM